MDTVKYTLRIKNHDFATGDLENPVGVDILPEELENPVYDENTGWSSNNSDIAKPGFASSTKTIGGKVRNLLKWSINGTLKPGEYVDVTFTARIKENTIAGKFTNTFYETTQQIFKSLGPVPDADNIDQNDSTTFLAASSKDIFVKFIGGMQSQKGVKGELDSDFTMYPLVGQTNAASSDTFAGGYADYRLKIKNNGSNGPINNIVLIDLFPNSGDKGILDTKDRQSQWRPNLVNNITIVNKPVYIDQSKIKVYYNYSTVPNPSIAQLNNPLNKDNIGWIDMSLTPPVDITSVLGIKIDIGDNKLQPNDEITFEWPMRAPYGTPAGKIAWNSFAYGATYPDTNGDEPFLPSEPIKVGYEVKDNPKDKVLIGNYVFEDLNKNGIQDPSDNGVNGVLVNLYDKYNNLLRYTRTGNDYTGNPGYYVFPNLTPGNYHIEMVLPKDYYLSPPNSGSDKAKDSDFTIKGGDAKTTGYTITSADINLQSNDITWDAGIYRHAEIGNYIWNDLNANGIQDAGDKGISGVNVELLDGNNSAVLQSTTTDSDGKYLFSELDPGSYKLKFYPKDSNYVFSDKDKTADSLDSDAQADGTTISTDLISNESDTSWDAGIHRAAIGDLVWHDYNADGIKTSDEPGIPGAKVKLYKDDDTFIGDKTTDSKGKYEFNDLDAGKYYLVFDKPAGYDKASPVGNGTSDIDSNGDSTTGKTGVFTISAGQRDNTWDSGFYKYVSIGDYVWNDKNANGIQNNTSPYIEGGISGVTVNLYKASDSTKLKTITTDANGKYKFDTLEPGDYYVEFMKLADYVFTLKDIGNNSYDSDADTTTGKTAVAKLRSGTNQNDTSWDAGLHKGYIGNYVWEDKNGDGIQNDGNAGINNVTVNLYDSSKNLIKTTITKNDISSKPGYYEFTDLEIGDYYVEFIAPTGYTVALKNSGSDVKLDSNADRTTGMTDKISLSSIGQVDDTIDAGMYKPASVGDFLFEDTNGNGIQDAGETGINGTKVTLLDKNGIEVGSMQTANDSNSKPGYYRFTDLMPGQYYIAFEKPSGYDEFTNQKTGSDTSKDSNTDKTGKTDSLSLGSGDNNLTIDSGVYKYTSVGDLAWEDKNSNGIQDDGENGISGVIVELYRKVSAAWNFISTLTTDSNGKYLFDKLMPGDYYLKFQTPNGYQVSPKNTGDSAKDSDVSLSNLQTDNIYLPSGKQDLNWDAGYYKLASIGDFVWDDSNNNGIQDNGENGIPNVKVELYDSSNNLNGTDTTDNDGKYQFINLIPGDYYVVFTKPAGYGFSDKNQGTDVDKDSNADLTSGKADTITLTSGENNISIDAGLHKLASLGDIVWEDINGNGLKDPGDYGISGVIVNLYDSSNNLKGTDTTDNDGKYHFINLEPSDYTVEFQLPDGYKFTKSNQGTDNNMDSDADTSTGKTKAITLIPGDNNLSLDAGMYKPASIGDRVFEDMNSNGIQDLQEKGIKEIKVNLYDKDTNTLVKSTKTDANGNYLFDNLIPSKYIVEFVLPPDYAYSPQYQGSDTGIDSNVSRNNGKTDTITILSGQIDMTVDALIYPVPDNSAAIGDYVWVDKNGNGTQDDGEQGVTGVTVNLYNEVETKIATMVTGDNGYYEFKNLRSGNYYVEFIKPDGFEFAIKNNGDTKTDSDSDIITGKTAIITLKNGEINTTIDAGVYKLASLGDFVWKDSNRNGIFDKGENGVRGVNINLYNDKNQLISSTRTDENGQYNFINLKPGKYYVKFLIPKDYSFSPQKQGNNIELDSNPNISNGSSDLVNLESGMTDNTIDAGIYYNGAIINTNNGGGTKIVDYSVELYDDNGNLIGGAPGKPVIKPVTNNSGLPKTAVDYYNTLVIGGVLLVISLLLLLVDKLRKSKAK